MRWRGPLLLIVMTVGALSACGGPVNSPETSAPAMSQESGDLPDFVPPRVDRIRQSDGGNEYIIGELVLILEDGPEDPTELATAIASEFGGRVLAGSPRLRMYQLRFADEGLDELRRLSDEIDDLRRVTGVWPHYVGRFEPDW